MKNLLSSLSWGDGKGQLPRDRLHPSALARGAACLAAAAGIPGTADACAYEPAQRLLAISTADGRVKIFGREGVERTLRGSAAGAGGEADPGTQQLLFLANRGALLRLDASGKLQLWAVDKQEEEIGEDDLRGASEPLHELSPGCDPVTAVTAVPQEPYVLLGCRSGAVRVAMAVDDSGSGVADARQVRRLKLMPYAVTADQLEGFGEVSQLSVARRGDSTLLLCIHSTGGAAVWDLRGQRLLAALEEDESPATSAAWLGDGGPRGDFATGHLNGDICIWALAPGAGGANGGNSGGANGGEASPRRQKLRLGLRLRQKAAEAAAAAGAGVTDAPGVGAAAAGAEAAGGPDAAPRARLVSRLRVAASDADGRAVRGIDYWQSGRTAGLLVCGGGEEEQPEGLALLPLPAAQGEGGPSDDSPADSGDEKEEGAEADDSTAEPSPPDAATDTTAATPTPTPIADSPTARARSATPAAAAAAVAGPRHLPWFGAIRGHCLVPAQGAMCASDDAAAAIVLLEGGELCVHDLVRGTSSGGGAAAGGLPLRLGVVRGPRGFRARFQGQAPVTAALLGVVPTEPLPLRGRGGSVCMEALREWAGLRGEDASGVASPTGDTGADGYSWMVDGGRPARIGAAPAPYATLYCTGHKDGGVRLWDLDSHVPLLLGRAPSPAAAAALDERSHGDAAVCAVELVWEDGLLLTGHDNGEVRIFQFSLRPRELSAIHFESVGGATANAATPLHEPVGFQLLGQVLVHSSPVTSLVYDPSTRTAAAGDAAGTVSLLDLSVPELLWLQAPFRGPVAALSLAPCPLPPARDRSDLLASRLAGAPTGAPLPCVVAVGDDATVGVMDAATGFFLSKEGRLRPKHPSAAVAVEALDSSGAPLWMARDIMALLAISRQQSFAGDEDAIAPPAALQSSGGPSHGSPSALRRRLSAASTGTGGARSRSGSPNRAITAGLAALGLKRTPSAASGAAAAAGAAAIDTAAAAAEGRTEGTPRSGAAAAATDAATPEAAVQEEGASGTAEEPAAAEGHSGVEEVQQEKARGVDPSNPFASAFRLGEEDEQAEAEGAEEEDIDRLLAAAAAHVGGTAESDALGSASVDEDDSDSSGSPTAATPAAATASSVRSAFAPVTPPLPSTPPPAAAAAATAAAMAVSSPRAVNPPVALPPDDGSAGYILVVTEDYLRLYPADGVTRGDRTVTRRVTPQGRVRFAAAFAAQGAPALMAFVDPPAAPPAGNGGSSGAIAAAAAAPQPPPQLQVYSLPGLQLVSSMPLAACCGWRCELAAREASPASVSTSASSASGGASSGADSSSEVRPSAALAATRHGHVAIVAPHCELVRLGLAVGLAPPLPPERVFDWDAAAAAHAMFDQSSSGAAAAAAVPATPSGVASRQGFHLAAVAAAAAAAAAAAPSDGDSAAAAGGEGEGVAGDGSAAGGEVPATPSAGAGRAKDFKGFMARIGQDFQKALDETQKGLQKVKQVPGLLSVRSKDVATAAPLPTLQEVFSTEVPGALLPSESPCASPQAALSTSSSSAAAATGAAGAAVSQLQQQQQQQQRGVGGSGGSGSGMGRRSWGFPRSGGSGGAAAARRELLASSSPAAHATASAAGPSSSTAAAGSGGTRVRTAAEIRAAYGRPSKADTAAGAGGAAEIGSVMAETMSRLGERGEKLRALESKGADLAESAAGFAEMAKQLAERERQKAKWFGLG